MAYISRQEKEEARWMRIRQALRQIMEADQCDAKNACNQLKKLIKDNPSTLRKRQLPWGGTGGVSFPPRAHVPCQVSCAMINAHWPTVISTAKETGTAVTAAEADFEQWLTGWLQVNRLAAEKDVMAAVKSRYPNARRVEVRALIVKIQGPRTRGRKPGKTEREIRERAKNNGELAN
jgi:hypothetical protein